MPHMVRIGNFSAGGSANDEFGIVFERLQDPASAMVWWDGQDLTTEEQAELNAALASLDPATVNFAHGASYILGELTRKVASRNKAVGRGLLITVLPRESIGGESSGMLMAAPAEERVQTFLYLAPDDREGIVYGPTVASGGAVLSDFMAGSLDAPEMADLKRAVEASQKSEDPS